MLRRNARLRREYLYRKSLEGKERAEYERKRAIRQALEGACPGLVDQQVPAAARQRLGASASRRDLRAPLAVGPSLTACTARRGQAAAHRAEARCQGPQAQDRARGRQYGGAAHAHGRRVRSRWGVGPQGGPRAVWLGRWLGLCST